MGAGEGAWAAGSLSREISLFLSAHGSAVVVVGTEERAIGEVLGEIVYGGGRGRHAVGDPADTAQVGAAIDKAAGAFGTPRALVVCGPNPIDFMPAVHQALSSRAIACRVLFLPAAAEDVGVEKRAAQVAALLT